MQIADDAKTIGRHLKVLQGTGASGEHFYSDGRRKLSDAELLREHISSLNALRDLKEGQAKELRRQAAFLRATGLSRADFEKMMAERPVGVHQAEFMAEMKKQGRWGWKKADVTITIDPKSFLADTRYVYPVLKDLTPRTYDGVVVRIDNRDVGKIGLLRHLIKLRDGSEIVALGENWEAGTHVKLNSQARYEKVEGIKTVKLPPTVIHTPVEVHVRDDADVKFGEALRRAAETLRGKDAALKVQFFTEDDKLLAVTSYQRNISRDNGLMTPMMLTLDLIGTDVPEIVKDQHGYKYHAREAQIRSVGCTPSVTVQYRRLH